MNMIRQKFITVGILMLAIAGCERSSHERSAASEPPSARSPDTFASAATPKLVKDQPQNKNFPITPNKLTILPTIQPVSLTHLDDMSLSETFLNSSGPTWNAALMEMKKRQTTALVAVLAKNLDALKSLTIGNGETYYVPELGYPVAQVLVDCGEKPIADLIGICKSPNLSLKQRVLAARVLRQIKTRGHDAASVERIRSTLTSPDELAAFNKLWAVADDDSQAADVLRDWVVQRD